MAKVKASQNKAENVEKKQTSEELAMLLNQNYTTLMQAQANIQAINQELMKRQTEKGKSDAE